MTTKTTTKTTKFNNAF